ncbi:MAG TPA: DUF3795 domain-containing protein [Syntrophales bacterium]|nr:DUF3795 domain-containing protein [Syntrophales bacterium]
MEEKHRFAAPCGLYCGACGIMIAHQENNLKLKEKLTQVYGVAVDEIRCEGCLSDAPFFFCKVCSIKSCAQEKKIAGCFQCDDFPCKIIDEFAFPVARQVMLRSVPAWKKLGTEQWMAEEEKRYSCPHCGCRLFRGVKRCRNCKEEVALDGA